MVAVLDLTNDEALAARAVDAVEAAGIPLLAAVWTADDYGRGWLYLVPDGSHPGEEPIERRVSQAIWHSQHQGELPWTFMHAVLRDHDPIIDSVREQTPARYGVPLVVQGSYGGGKYIDRAVVYRWTLPD